MQMHVLTLVCDLHPVYTIQPVVQPVTQLAVNMCKVSSKTNISAKSNLVEMLLSGLANTHAKQTSVFVRTTKVIIKYSHLPVYSYEQSITDITTNTSREERKKSTNLS